jgi:ABC transport system ATP-binding/permease protein
VLDEPTNDLDIDTLELLEDLLQQYEGTVFLVSHDRRFLNNVVTSTLVSEGDGAWREYVGDVEDWMTQSARAQMNSANAAPAPVTSASKPAPAVAALAGKRKLSYKEQRERDALPETIAALEKEQAAIAAQLENGQLFATDLAKATQLSARHAEVEAQWLSAMERLDELSTSAA